jgi:AcrR family transcriptional regulator
MVRAAAELIRTKGVSGTGLREVVATADAPRGSLQHYFPEGKDQLVAEALSRMGSVATRRVGRVLRDLDPPTPSAVLAGTVELWRRDFTDNGFRGGCPLVAAAADVAATSDAIRSVVGQAFDGWEEAMAGALEVTGVPAGRCRSLAMVVISALEGAIVMARVRRDDAPLDALVAELGPVLDAAASGA